MDKNKLIEAHLDNVKKAAYHYYKLVGTKYYGMISPEDLISAGNVGLVEAAEKFEGGGRAKFSTYAYKWINGAIMAELEFYIGTDVLLLDDESWESIPSFDKGLEDALSEHGDIDELSDERKAAIVTRRLKEYKLTDDEISVYIAINGIGCERATNLRALARQLGKREMDIRRLKQSAEKKVRREIFDV